MLSYLRFFVDASLQVQCIIHYSSSLCKKFPRFYPVSLLIDYFIFLFFKLECKTSSLNISKLIVGHPLGIVLGGNGISCSGSLHLSSGVVFARKYFDQSSQKIFFNINGNLTVGANSVIMGPSTFEGNVIVGALTLLPPGHYTSGIYVGAPAKKL